MAVVRSGWAEEEGETEDKLKEKGEGKEEEEDQKRRRKRRTDRWRRAERSVGRRGEGEGGPECSFSRGTKRKQE